MIEEVIDFVQLNAGDDKAELFKRATETLSTFNVDDYIISLNNTLGTAEDFDSQHIIGSLDRILADSVYDTLAQHGIHLSDYATDNVSIIILEAVKRIEDYENYQEVTDILSNEDEDIQKLADILALTVEITGDDITEAIEYINPSILRKIRLMFENRQLVNSEYQEEPEAIKNIKLIKKLYAIEDKTVIKSLIDISLASGLKIGLSFNQYLNMYWEIISEFNPKELSRELVAISLISSDVSNQLETIHKFISMNLSDIDLIAVLKKHVDQYFLAINQNFGVQSNN